MTRGPCGHIRLIRLIRPHPATSGSSGHIRLIRRGGKDAPAVVGTSFFIDTPSNIYMQTERLPDDIQEIILFHYRRELNRRIVNRCIVRVLSQYRKALDGRVERPHFYTRRTLRTIRMVSLLCGYRTGDLRVLGRAPRVFARLAFDRRLPV